MSDGTRSGVNWMRTNDPRTARRASRPRASWRGRARLRAGSARGRGGTPSCVRACGPARRARASPRTACVRAAWRPPPAPGRCLPLQRSSAVAASGGRRVPGAAAVLPALSGVRGLLRVRRRHGDRRVGLALGVAARALLRRGGADDFAAVLPESPRYAHAMPAWSTRVARRTASSAHHRGAPRGPALRRGRRRDGGRGASTRPGGTAAGSRWPGTGSAGRPWAFPSSCCRRLELRGPPPRPSTGRAGSGYPVRAVRRRRRLRRPPMRSTTASTIRIAATTISPIRRTSSTDVDASIGTVFPASPTNVVVPPGQLGHDAERHRAREPGPRARRRARSRRPADR